MTSTSKHSAGQLVATALPPTQRRWMAVLLKTSSMSFRGTRQALCCACCRKAFQVLLERSVLLCPTTTSAVRARDSATFARLQSSRKPTWIEQQGHATYGDVCDLQLRHWEQMRHMPGTKHACNPSGQH